MSAKQLYPAVIAIGQKYLGPAGERFMRRQIDTHLGIKPEAVSKKDIPKLADWTGIAFAMLTEDTTQRESFKNELLALANNHKRNS